MTGRRTGPTPGLDAARSAAEDWQPAKGLVNRMLAYSDWWNIAAVRPRSSNRV